MTEREQSRKEKLKNEMIKEYMIDDVRVYDLIDTIMHLIVLHFNDYQNRRVSARELNIMIINCFDMFNTRAYDKLLYNSVFLDLYDKLRITLTYTECSNIAYEYTQYYINELLFTVNEFLIDSNYHYFFERVNDKFTAKTINHITEQYRRDTKKATYNLDAYINQYVDFYSNI